MSTEKIASAIEAIAHCEGCPEVTLATHDGKFVVTMDIDEITVTRNHQRVVMGSEHVEILRQALNAWEMARTSFFDGEADEVTP